MWRPTHVQVTVIRARGIKTKGKSGTNDAYVSIKHGKEKFETSVKERSKNPEWNEKCQFSLREEDPLVKVKVFHRNLLGKDDLLGYAEIPLENIREPGRAASNRWYALHGKEKSRGSEEKSRGEIECIVALHVENLSGSQLVLSNVGKTKRFSFKRSTGEKPVTKLDERGSFRANPFDSLHQTSTNENQDKSLLKTNNNSNDCNVSRECETNSRTDTTNSRTDTRSHSRTLSSTAEDDVSLDSVGLQCDETETKNKKGFIATRISSLKHKNKKLAKMSSLSQSTLGINVTRSSSFSGSKGEKFMKSIPFLGLSSTNAKTAGTEEKSSPEPAPSKSTPPATTGVEQRDVIKSSSIISNSSSDAPSSDSDREDSDYDWHLGKRKSSTGKFSGFVIRELSSESASVDTDKPPAKPPRLELPRASIASNKIDRPSRRGSAVTKTTMDDQLPVDTAETTTTESAKFTDQMEVESSDSSNKGQLNVSEMASNGDALGSKFDDDNVTKIGNKSISQDSAADPWQAFSGEIAVSVEDDLDKSFDGKLPDSSFSTFTVKSSSTSNEDSLGMWDSYVAGKDGRENKNMDNFEISDTKVPHLGAWESFTDTKKVNVIHQDSPFDDWIKPDSQQGDWSGVFEEFGKPYSEPSDPSRDNTDDLVDKSAAEILQPSATPPNLLDVSNKKDSFSDEILDSNEPNISENRHTEKLKSTTDDSELLLAEISHSNKQTDNLLTEEVVDGNKSATDERTLDIFGGTDWTNSSNVSNSSSAWESFDTYNSSANKSMLLEDFFIEDGPFISNDQTTYVNAGLNLSNQIGLFSNDESNIIGSSSSPGDMNAISAMPPGPAEYHNILDSVIEEQDEEEEEEEEKEDEEEEDEKDDVNSNEVSYVKLNEQTEDDSNLGMQEANDPFMDVLLQKLGQADQTSETGENQDMERHSLESDEEENNESPLNLIHTDSVVADESKKLNETTEREKPGHLSFDDDKEMILPDESSSESMADSPNYVNEASFLQQFSGADVAEDSQHIAAPQSAGVTKDITRSEREASPDPPAEELNVKSDDFVLDINQAERSKSPVVKPSNDDFFESNDYHSTEETNKSDVLLPKADVDVPADVHLMKDRDSYSKKEEDLLGVMSLAGTDIKDDILQHTDENAETFEAEKADEVYPESSLNDNVDQSKISVTEYDNSQDEVMKLTDMLKSEDSVSAKSTTASETHLTHAGTDNLTEDIVDKVEGRALVHDMSLLDWQSDENKPSTTAEIIAGNYLEDEVDVPSEIHSIEKKDSYSIKENDLLGVMSSEGTDIKDIFQYTDEKAEESEATEPDELYPESNLTDRPSSSQSKLLISDIIFTHEELMKGNDLSEEDSVSPKSISVSETQLITQAGTDNRTKDIVDKVEVEGQVQDISLLDWQRDKPQPSTTVDNIAENSLEADVDVPSKIHSMEERDTYSVKENDLLGVMSIKRTDTKDDILQHTDEKAELFEATETNEVYPDSNLNDNVDQSKLSVTEYDNSLDEVMKLTDKLKSEEDSVSAKSTTVSETHLTHAGPDNLTEDIVDKVEGRALVHNMSLLDWQSDENKPTTTAEIIAENYLESKELESDLLEKQDNSVNVSEDVDTSADIKRVTETQAIVTECSNDADFGSAQIFPDDIIKVDTNKSGQPVLNENTEYLLDDSRDELKAFGVVLSNNNSFNVAQIVSSNEQNDESERLQDSEKVDDEIMRNFVANYLSENVLNVDPSLDNSASKYETAHVTAPTNALEDIQPAADAFSDLQRQDSTESETDSTDSVRVGASDIISDKDLADLLDNENLENQLDNMFDSKHFITELSRIEEDNTLDEFEGEAYEHTNKLIDVVINSTNESTLITDLTDDYAAFVVQDEHGDNQLQSRPLSDTPEISETTDEAETSKVEDFCLPVVAESVQISNLLSHESSSQHHDIEKTPVPEPDIVDDEIDPSILEKLSSPGRRTKTKRRAPIPVEFLSASAGANDDEIKHEAAAFISASSVKPHEESPVPKDELQQDFERNTNKHLLIEGDSSLTREGSTAEADFTEGSGDNFYTDPVNRTETTSEPIAESNPAVVDPVWAWDGLTDTRRDTDDVLNVITVVRGVGDVKGIPYDVNEAVDDDNDFIAGTSLTQIHENVKLSTDTTNDVKDTADVVKIGDNKETERADSVRDSVNDIISSTDNFNDESDNNEGTIDDDAKDLIDDFKEVQNYAREHLTDDVRDINDDVSNFTDDDEEATDDTTSSTKGVKGTSSDIEEGSEVLARSIPHQDVERSIPHQEVERSIPHQEVERSIPHQEVERSIPHQEVERSIPYQEIKGSLSHQEEEEKDTDMIGEELILETSVSKSEQTKNLISTETKNLAPVEGKVSHTETGVEREQGDGTEVEAVASSRVASPSVPPAIPAAKFSAEPLERSESNINGVNNNRIGVSQQSEDGDRNRDEDQKAHRVTQTSPPDTDDPDLSPETQLQYYNYSRNDLIRMLLEQRKSLQQKDAYISDLENYIDNLVVKVLDIQPKILLAPTQSGDDVPVVTSSRSQSVVETTSKQREKSRSFDDEVRR